MTAALAIRPAAAPPAPVSVRGWTTAQDRALLGLCRSRLTGAQICAELRALADVWGRRPSELTARLEWLLGPAAVDLGRASPLEQALVSLFGRATEDPRRPGGFRLDGRPADAAAVVRAANAVRTCQGQPPIRYPGGEVWHG